VLTFQSLTGIAGHLDQALKILEGGTGIVFQSLTGIAGHLDHSSGMEGVFHSESFNP